MNARAYILLGISLMALASHARATSVGETASFGGAASLYDSSRVLTIDAASHGRLRWVRRSPRTRVLGGLQAQPKPEGGSSPTNAYLGATAGPFGLAVDQNLCGADGDVLGLARSGNTLFIAGSFRSVGEISGGCVPFDARTGQALNPFPKVAGAVHAIVSDGSGGWYIGGEFTGVGGKLRSCLAQIRADGSVSDWNPAVSGTSTDIGLPAIMAIAVHGNRVYVGGGDFQAIGGLPRSGLGCIDAQTGAVLAGC